MNVGIASDHKGYELKQKIAEILIELGYNVINYGTDSTEMVDFPDYALKIGDAIKDNNIVMGILICGTGIGISIACNKIKGIRCAKVNNILEAELSRFHNNANVIAINGDLKFEIAIQVIEKFLTTDFSNEERHIIRINKINKIENDNL